MEKLNKTKIICTIGPVSDERETLKSLMLAGMNGARFNFSHGSHEEQQKRINQVKELSAELDLPIALILDTKGPEIRTGKFKNDKVELKEGDTFTITTDGSIGDSSSCSATYDEIVYDVKSGDKILLDDGLISLTVTDIDTASKRIVTLIDNDGELSNNKSINLPGVHVNLPSITEKDKDDILFGIENDLDYIAASFTRTAEDVMKLRSFLDNNGGREVGIISKIENKEGVDNIDDIIGLSDGIMVARGDLGVEIPQEQVPLIQKDIIKKCNLTDGFVITATQMLDSMIRNPRPTRAEVADVANAIFDGTDCIMLSGETAAGNYPLEAVQMMADIAITTEEKLDFSRNTSYIRAKMDLNIPNSVAASACEIAESLNVKAIFAPTASGYTASAMSTFWPSVPIIAFATTPKVMRRIALYWGVIPFYHKYDDHAKIFFEETIASTKEKGLVEEGDLIIIVAGFPFGVAGKANMLRIHKVGDAF
jgi:pyruvate kinase